MQHNTIDNECILDKGGEVAYIRVGNTVIDVMHGHQHGDKNEPACAVVTIYKYDNKKPSRLIIYDNKTIILSR